MISPLERLRALREGRSLEEFDLTGPDSLPMDWRIEFEERAAILEYEAGLAREEAEVQALQEVRERMKISEKS